MKLFTTHLLVLGCLFLSPSSSSDGRDRSGDITWITAFPDSTESYESRLEQLNEELRQQPRDADLYLKRGAIYLGLHRFNRAIGDFDMAIKQADLDEAYFGRGLARGRIQQFDTAIEDITIYLDRHPGSSVAYTKRGIRNLWNADRDAAKADFMKALELDPANAEANDDLGVIYAQEGDFGRAIRHFKDTIRIDATYHKAYHNLAMAYYLTSQNLAALSTVNQSILLLPGFRDSLLLKAEILKALGQQEQAQSLIEQAGSLDSGNWSERAPLQ